MNGQSNNLQLTINVATKDEVKKSWAFAMDKRSGIISDGKKKGRRARQTAEDYKHYVIISCSKQAKALGIKAGMRYHDAKQLIPGMRIMIVGTHKTQKA